MDRYCVKRDGLELSKWGYLVKVGDTEGKGEGSLPEFHRRVVRKQEELPADQKAGENRHTGPPPNDAK